MDDQAVALAVGMGIGCVIVLVHRAYARRQVERSLRAVMESNPVFAEEMAKVLSERG